MKPCRSLRKINKLIRHHQDMVATAEYLKLYHNNRITQLNAYKRELQKPGFRNRSQWIVIEDQQTQDTLITPHNTWKEE